MKKGGIGGLLIFIFIVFMLFGPFREPILDGIKGWRTNTTTESSIVTTASAQTSANVTLDYELYQAATAEVIDITSNETSDNPVAALYTESTQALLVSGLAPSKTHSLSIQYYAETDDTVMRTIGPFIAALLFLFIFGTSAWKLFHR